MSKTIAMLAVMLALGVPAMPSWAQKPPAAGAVTAGETALWDTVRNSNDPDDLQAYLDAYPQGAYAGLARERLTTLPGGVVTQSAPPAVSQAEVGPAPQHACDQLAEPPHQAMGNAAPAFTLSGIADDQVDLKAALAACTAAMNERPNEPRFIAYVARILDQSGDIAGSKPLYRRAADLGNPFAAYVVGGDYLLGRDGTPVDGAQAVRYLRAAAQGGVVYALVPLAGWYLDGSNGVRKDEREAARLYRMAADQRDAGAQAGLASMIQHGQGGLVRDDREAVRLYRLAADQGEPWAQFCLGTIYEYGWHENGFNTPQNEQTAERFFRLAADAGLADAQYRLGLMYQDGRGGLPKDESSAVTLFTMAADKGSAPAKAALLKLRSAGVR